MVLFEAMAAGVPIVAARVGGVPDILDAEAGWLVTPDDAGALAETLRSALQAPAEGAARAGRAAARLSREFQTAPWVAQYDALYHAILGSARS